MNRTTKFVKDFLAKNRVYVEYIHDGNGFRRGVVVAINKDQIGWSLVAKEDYVPYVGRVIDIPAIQKIAKEADFYDGELTASAAIAAIFSLPVFKAIEDFRVPMQPAFDKYIGLAAAIRRAYKDKGQDRELPSDAATREAITRVLERSQTFFDPK